jgi:DNA polymerase III epsilon subunit-like protein
VTIADIFDRFLLAARPRPRLHAAGHAPLERLPLVVIDCETTGLDPRRDRIVSIAAVEIGPGLAVGRTRLDAVVDPRMPIPPQATAVHGIDAAQVAGAPTIADLWEQITDAIGGHVVVGHHVAFDVTMLAAEARRAGLAWQEPPCLDTAALLEGMGLATDRPDLEDVLPRLGIEPRGKRHSALGDATMTADLFVALARRLRGQGRGTFGGAVAAQRLPSR